MADHATKTAGALALPSKGYDVLKHIAQIYLPAGGTLYVALASIWHLPNQIEVMASVTAVDAFLGVVLGISSVSYKASDKSNDGAVTVNPVTNEVTNLDLSKVTAEDMATKNQIVLKVNSVASDSQ